MRRVLGPGISVAYNLGGLGGAGLASGGKWELMPRVQEAGCFQGGR